MTTATHLQVGRSALLWWSGQLRCHCGRTLYVGGAAGSGIACRCGRLLYLVVALVEARLAEAPSLGDVLSHTRQPSQPLLEGGAPAPAPGADGISGDSQDDGTRQKLGGRRVGRSNARETRREEPHRPERGTFCTCRRCDLLRSITQEREMTGEGSSG